MKVVNVQEIVLQIKKKILINLTITSTEIINKQPIIILNLNRLNNNVKMKNFQNHLQLLNLPKKLNKIKNLLRQNLKIILKKFLKKLPNIQLLMNKNMNNQFYLEWKDVENVIEHLQVIE